MQQSNRNRSRAEPSSGDLPNDSSSAAGSSSPASALLDLALAQISGQAMSREQIERVLDEAKSLALAAGGLGLAQFRIGAQLVRLIYIVSHAASANTPEGTLSGSSATTSIFPEDILGDVESALQNYHFTPRLAANRLTRLLDLRRFSLPQDPIPFASGLTLRRALDEALDALVENREIDLHRPTPVRAAQYLHLRYRQLLSMPEIAERLNYSDRHLRRLGKELIQQVAEVLLTQSRS